MIVLIYLMAGGFQGAAAAMGGKDSVVNLCLHFIPVKLLVPGVFLMCCFISTSIGTSMGTIAAMAPIAINVAQGAHLNVAVVGASRRFLAQITRHQNEVKFMSASLQYSDYSDEADFVVPYELLNSSLKDSYILSCEEAMERYKQLASADNDSAGYVTPQGLRNILIISATPYQWKHMIGQRICRRNTAETRYVMLKIWKELYELSPELFSGGCFCMTGGCKEGKMSCGKPISAGATPDEIIKADFPLLAGGFSGYENKID